MVSMEKHKHTSHIPYAYLLAQIRLSKYLPGVKIQEVREYNNSCSCLSILWTTVLFMPRISKEIMLESMARMLPRILGIDMTATL